MFVSFLTRPTALLTVLILLGLLLSACSNDPSMAQGNNMSNTPGSKAAPDPQCKQSTAQSHPTSLQQVHMLNASVGWAVAQDRGQNGQSGPSQVLHTSDGGCHWQITKTLTVSDSQNQPATFFLSESNAFVFDGGKLYHSSDSGKNWSEKDLSLAASGESTRAIALSFSDAQHGWLLAETGHPPFVAQMVSQTIVLARTADGGQTWQKMQTVDSAQDKDAPNSLPTQSAYRGMRFLDADTGWVSGQRFGQDEGKKGWFYVTYDGGRTWKEQKLNLPSSLTSSDGVQLNAPTFFGPRDGIMGASVDESSQPHGIFGYITHDGGASWQSLPFLRIDNFSQLMLNPSNDPNVVTPAIYLILPPPQFADMRYGWLANQILQTRDGGQTWERGPLPPVGYNGGQVWMLNSQQGWAWGSSNAQKQPGSALYRTGDGGKTWTQLMYSVS